MTPRQLGYRRWLAWKLVQLAERIHPSQSEEVITVRSKFTGTTLVEIGVVEDLYGAGVSYVHGELPSDLELTWGDDPIAHREDN